MKVTVDIPDHTMSWPELAKIQTVFAGSLVYRGMAQSVAPTHIQYGFIISTGRTGTKFFKHYLDTLPDTTAFHEPTPDLLDIGINLARGKITPKDARRYISASRSLQLLITNSLQSKHYVESNNRLFSLIPILPDIFPSCRILHIVRDGRDVVRSCMNRKYYTSADGFFRNGMRIQAVDFPDDPYAAKWSNMTPFEKTCWWWTKKDRTIYDAVLNNPNSITLKFEDLFDATTCCTSLDLLLQHLRIPYTPSDLDRYSEWLTKKINAQKTHSFPHWDEWTDEHKQQFQAICGEHMALYGYTC